MSTDRLTVSLPPHQPGPESVAKIMWAVVLALVPTTIAGIYFYGIRALVVPLVAAAVCVLTEHLIARYLFKSERTTVYDGSAVITGLLLAFNVPASIPLWQIAVGSVIAIGVAKMAFGGLGNNPFNPALVGRAFMLASFPVEMTSWPVPRSSVWVGGPDVVTGATPLGILKEGGALESLPSHWDLFVGNIGGCIGEVSALAVLIGGLYLVYRGYIRWFVPVTYLAALAAITGVFWVADPATHADPLYHVLAGGAMLGAWFMVTDMTTSPMSVKGKLIFAGAAGLLAGLIRLVGGYPEGVSYSILIMNALVPIIDRYAKPRRFGTRPMPEIKQAVATGTTKGADRG